MTTVTAAVAAALRIAEHSIREPRPGEVAIEVQCGGFAVRLPMQPWPIWTADSCRCLPPMSEPRVDASSCGTSGLCHDSGRFCASRLRSIPPSPRFPRSPPGIPQRTGSRGK